METVTTVNELRSLLAALPTTEALTGLVPTMGALHEGHLSLVRRSLVQCQTTIVSIFVNPTQFAAGEDLSEYPRPIEHDLRLLKAEGVDVVFLPDAAEMYPPGFSSGVQPPEVATKLEGESRPEHFRGVTTVVLKLFNMTSADVAFFGQKDYQQSLVVQRMVQDLNVPVRIEVCPIVRDADGLALSSRNVYLTGDQRVPALSLNRTLRDAASAIRCGETDARALVTQMNQTLIDGGVNEIDYAVVVDADTLEMQERVQLPVALLVAARVGTTRLIDNVVLRVQQTDPLEQGEASEG